MELCDIANFSLTIHSQASSEPHRPILRQQHIDTTKRITTSNALEMSAAPMTPTDEPFDPGPNRGWSEASSIPPNKYDASFDDSVMRTVLSPPPQSGAVLLNDGDPFPTKGEFMPRSSILEASLPDFPQSSLPLRLNHPLRIYRSTVPGIRYAHPYGDLEGGEGEGASANRRANFARELIEDNRICNATQFWRIVDQEKRETLKELEQKMQTRQDAIRQNEKLEGQLDALKEQRDLEVRVWNRRKQAMGKG